jgi:hypothetical protein
MAKRINYLKARRVRIDLEVRCDYWDRPGPGEAYVSPVPIPPCPEDVPEEYVWVSGKEWLIPLFETTGMGSPQAFKYELDAKEDAKDIKGKQMLLKLRVR